MCNDYTADDYWEAKVELVPYGRTCHQHLKQETTDHNISHRELSARDSFISALADGFVEQDRCRHGYVEAVADSTHR